MSRVIFVSGPQGSGSSAVAGALHNLGVSMGERLMEASPLNPKGHYECLDFEDIIRPWLFEYNHHHLVSDIPDNLKKYTKQRSLNSIWGIKSPVVVNFINYIIPHINEYKIISIDRPFEACIKSSMLKYPEMSWENIEIMHNNIRRIREEVIDRYDIKNLSIDYNDLTTNISKNIKDIADFCFDGMEYPSQLKIASAVNFIDPSFNHRREL